MPGHHVDWQQNVIAVADDSHAVRCCTLSGLPRLLQDADHEEVYADGPSDSSLFVKNWPIMMHHSSTNRNDPYGRGNGPAAAGDDPRRSSLLYAARVTRQVMLCNTPRIVWLEETWRR
jgi:hypothetical protein